MAKPTLENILRAVLSVGNREQNSSYPPYVYESHARIVTSFLLDKLSASYPYNVDVLRPFIRTKRDPIKEGCIVLPDDYRNLLGSPSINVRPDGKDCGASAPDNAMEFKQAQLRGGCKSYPIEIVSAETWDDLTTSTYGFPTYTKPIGKFVEGNKIKVCPYDLGSAEITYVVKESEYVVGYIMQPDDTYIIDSVTTTEFEWEEPAFKYLFKGVLALYSAYSRDNTIMDYSQVLNKEGVL